MNVLYVRPTGLPLLRRWRRGAKMSGCSAFLPMATTAACAEWPWRAPSAHLQTWWAVHIILHFDFWMPAFAYIAYFFAYSVYYFENTHLHIKLHILHITLHIILYLFCILLAYFARLSDCAYYSIYYSAYYAAYYIVYIIAYYAWHTYILHIFFI